MTQTADAVQAQLGPPTGARVLMVHGPNSGATQFWLVSGGVDSPGVLRWVEVSTSQTASQHATSIKNGIKR